MNAVQLNEKSIHLIREMIQAAEPWKDSAYKVKLVTQRIDFMRIEGKNPDLENRATYRCEKFEEFEAGSNIVELKKLLKKEIKIVQEFVAGKYSWQHSNCEQGVIMKFSIRNGNRPLKTFTYYYNGSWANNAPPAKRRKLA